MKKFSFLLVLIFSAALFSCDDDRPIGPTTTVNLGFRATYDGAPLVMLRHYDYPDLHKVFFQQFNFYIADVALLEAEAGDEAVLTEIEFLDFSNNTTDAEAMQPLAFSFERVPVGTYKGIRIGIGVPEDLNKSDAQQFGAGHPLNQTFASHFWSDWGSFIFLKSEGTYDLDGNAVFDSADAGFGHHPGTNAAYQEITILQPIELIEGQALDLNFLVDILKIYQENGATLDLANPDKRDTQDAADLPLAIEMMSNFEQAISIE